MGFSFPQTLILMPVQQCTAYQNAAHREVVVIVSILYTILIRFSCILVFNIFYLFIYLFIYMKIIVVYKNSIKKKNSIFTTPRTIFQAVV